MSDMALFRTCNNVSAHVICSKLKTNMRGDGGDRLESALFIVKNVDMTCCGMAMDKEGVVYEVVEGAYEECKSRILTVNKGTQSLHIQKLIERSAMLEKRGWKNSIDIALAEKIVKEILEKENEKHENVFGGEIKHAKESKKGKVRKKVAEKKMAGGKIPENSDPLDMDKWITVDSLTAVKDKVEAPAEGMAKAVRASGGFSYENATTTATGTYSTLTDVEIAHKYDGEDDEDEAEE
jgi:hypothetical protein